MFLDSSPRAGNRKRRNRHATLSHPPPQLWADADELAATSAKSGTGLKEMSDRLRWIRTYVVNEEDGSLGCVCLFEAHRRRGDPRTWPPHRQDRDGDPPRAGHRHREPRPG
jgi:hypothetical protein